MPSTLPASSSKLTPFTAATVASLMTKLTCRFSTATTGRGAAADCVMGSLFGGAAVAGARDAHVAAHQPYPLACRHPHTWHHPFPPPPAKGQAVPKPPPQGGAEGI